MQTICGGEYGKLVALLIVFAHWQLPSARQRVLLDKYWVQTGLQTGTVNHVCHWQREFSSHVVFVSLRWQDLSQSPVSEFQKQLISASQESTVR
jgi:hypothetical protein